MKEARLIVNDMKKHWIKIMFETPNGTYYGYEGFATGVTRGSKTVFSEDKIFLHCAGFVMPAGTITWWNL